VLEKSSVPPQNLKVFEETAVISASQFSPMPVLFTSFFATLPSIVRSPAALEIETLALRRQIGVLQRCAAKRFARCIRPGSAAQVLAVWLGSYHSSSLVKCTLDALAML
jgi:hypothetical protein